MGSWKIFFGTHINVIVSGVIQDCVYTYGGGNADRAGGQAEVAVGVVGRIDGEVCIGNTAQAEVLDRKSVV